MLLVVRNKHIISIIASTRSGLPGMEAVACRQGILFVLFMHVYVMRVIYYFHYHHRYYHYYHHYYDYDYEYYYYYYD